MSLLLTVRRVAFCFLLLCSIVVLGITANYLSVGIIGFSSSFAGLGLATAVITLITVISGMLIGFLRKGAVTTMVAVELTAVGLLWVLWLAAAAGLSNFMSGLTDEECNLFISTIIVSLCHQLQAGQAFAWLAWIDLTIYFGFLLSSSITAVRRGNTGVWTQSVVDTDFLAPPNKNVITTSSSNNQAASTLMHHQYPSQQLYMQPGSQQPQMTGNSLPQTNSTIQPIRGAINV